MRDFSQQLRKDTSTQEAANASTAAPTTSSQNDQSTSSSFAWPSGNAYHDNKNYAAKAKFQSKTLLKEEKATEAVNLSSSPSPKGPLHKEETSTTTSLTAKVLRDAAKHCIKGQELVSLSSSASDLNAAIQEYQSAIYILERTIGSGVTDRREFRSWLVLSQIFYWMGLTFRKLASCSSTETSLDVIVDLAKETNEGNAIQSFLACLRLRYHLLDREEVNDAEHKVESEEDAATALLLNGFVSPLMDIQLVLTNLWESSPSPFCHMTPLESACKLHTLRVATWNEDRGDACMFAVADGKSLVGDNLDKALVHYQKAMESFSDENHKNDNLRLKIASCFRQIGLRKLNAPTRNITGANKDFDAAAFWYRSALKSFCGTVRFAPSALAEVSSNESSSSHSANDASVSSIDMSSACSLDDDDNVPSMIKHPTYERILARLEEILSWKQHQKQKMGNTASIELDIAKRHYLRLRLKESIAYQIRADTMRSPTAAWRRRPSKRIRLKDAGIYLPDDAASTMSAMSVLSNALIMLRASLRIEEAVWGESHPIVQSIQESIDVTDEEYLEAEEHHTNATEANHRVQESDQKSKDDSNFQQHVEDLVEENQRPRTALDGSTGTTSSVSVYQQKSGEPSNDKAATPALAAQVATPPRRMMPISSINVDETNRPLEFINIISSQTVQNGSDRLPFETRGYVAPPRSTPSKFATPQHGFKNLNLFPDNSTVDISARSEERFESVMHVMSRCRTLENELKKANEKIHSLTSRPQDETSINLKKQCQELQEELEKSSKVQEMLREQSIDSAEIQKTENENNLLISRLSRMNEELEAMRQREKTLTRAQENLEVDHRLLTEMSQKAVSDLHASKDHCAQLELSLTKSQKELETIREHNYVLRKGSEDNDRLNRVVNLCEELQQEVQAGEILPLSTGEDTEQQSNDDGEIKRKPTQDPENPNEDSEQIKQMPLMVIQDGTVEHDIQKTSVLALLLALEKDKNDRDQRIAELEKDKIDRDQRIAELEKDKNDRDDRIAELEKDKNDRDDRIVKLEKDKEDRDDRIAKLEKDKEERDDRIARLEQEQDNAAKHNIQMKLVIVLLLILENDKQARDHRITELEEQLNTAIEVRKSDEAIFQKYLEALERKIHLDATKIDGQESYEKDDMGLGDNNVNVSNRVHTIENETLAIRMSKLTMELEMAEEKGRIEKERIEKGLHEKLEQEMNRVKELQGMVDIAKQEEKRTEKQIQDMMTRQQIEGLLSSCVAGVEKRVTTQNLRDIAEERRNDSKQIELLRAELLTLEKDLEVSQSCRIEAKQLRKTVAELELQIEETNSENKMISSQLQSIELLYNEKVNEHNLAVARCADLGSELDFNKNNQEKFIEQITELEEKLELSRKTNSDISSEIASYESKVKTEQELLKKVNDEHQDLFDRVFRLEAEGQEFQKIAEKSAEHTGQTILDLSKALDKMTKEKDSTSLELFMLEEKLNTSLETSKNLTSQIEKMMASSESEKEEKAQVENLASERVQELETAIENMREEKLHLKKRNVLLEKELETEKDDKEREQATLTERIVELEGELETALANINNYLSATVQRTIDEENENDKLVKRSIELEQEIEDLREMKTAEQKGLNENIDRLEKQLEMVFEKNEKNEDAKDELTNQVSALKIEMVEVEESNKKLALEVEQQNGKTKALQEDLDSKMIENEINEERITTLQSKLDSISVDNERIVSENEAAEKELKFLKLKLEKNTEEANGMAAQLTMTKKSLKTSKLENEELMSKLSSIQEAQEKLESIANTEAVERQGFIEQIATLQKDFDEVSVEKNNLSKEIEALSKVDVENKRLSDRILDLEKHLVASSMKSSRLSKVIESLEKEKSKADDQQLESRLSELEKELQSSQEKNHQLTAEINTCKAQKKENERLQEHISDIESELVSLKAMNLCLSATSQSSNNKDEENRRLSDQLSDLELKLRASEATNRKLTATIESFEEKEEEHQRTLDRLSHAEAELDALEKSSRSRFSEVVAFREEEEVHKSRIADLETELASSLVENKNLASKIELLKSEQAEQLECITELYKRLTSLEGTEDDNADDESGKGKSSKRNDGQILDRNVTVDRGALYSQDDYDEHSEVDIDEISLASRSSSVSSLSSKASESSEEESESESYSDSESSEESEECSMEEKAGAFPRLSSRQRSRKVSSQCETKHNDKEEYDRMKVRLSKLEDENVTQQESIRLKEEEIAGFVNQISKLESNLEIMTKENATQLECIRLKEEEIGGFMNQISKLESDTKENATQQESIRLKEEEIADLVSQISKLKSDLDITKKENVTQQESIRLKEEEIADFVNQISKLESDLDITTKENMTQQESIRSKEEEISGFASQISKLESNLDITTKENELLAQDGKLLDSVKNSLNIANEENKSLQDRCNEYQQESCDIKKEMERLKAQVEDEKKSLIEKNEAGKKENDILTARCSELKNLVDEAKEENREITALLREKSSRIEALNKSVDEIEGLREKAFERDQLAHQCSQLEEEIVTTIKSNEELTEEMNSLRDEIDILNSTIFDSKVDLKEQSEELENAQRRRSSLMKQCSTLEKELGEVADQYKELANKIAYPDSVEDGHEWTRLQLKEIENRMEGMKMENEMLESRMEDVMEENELLLTRLKEYKANLKREKSIRRSMVGRNLEGQCQELEKSLLETVDINEDLKDEVVTLKKQIEDWKVYAETIEGDLEEEAEALQEAETKNEELLTAMTILNQKLRETETQNEKIEQNNDAIAQMLEAQNELTDQCNTFKRNFEEVKEERDKAKKDIQALNAAKADLQTMLEEAVQDIHELEESSAKLKAVVLAKNELQRLLDKAELGRDEIAEKYSQCKLDLQSAKELLQEADAAREELSRQLEIEQKVSSAYKSQNGNEFDDLYRKTREEMNEIEMALEESRACVADLEENVEILQHQLQAALTFKLQQPKKQPIREGNLFGRWRAGNKDSTTETVNNGPSS